MKTKNLFLYLPLLLALMLGTMGCSSDDDDIPDGWEKGPAGFFTLKINREMPVENASALLEAIIVTSPNVTSPVEKTLFCHSKHFAYRNNISTFAPKSTNHKYGETQWRIYCNFYHTV